MPVGLLVKAAFMIVKASSAGPTPFEAEPKNPRKLAS